MLTKDLQGQKKVQSEIKAFLSQLELENGWKEVPPNLSNIIRHAMIRLAWTCYKIGLLSS